MVESEPIPPEPSGPFFSNYGPRDGLIMYGGAPVMGVLDGQGAVVGIAWLGGAIASRRGPVQLWELEVGERSKVRLEGRWICRNREFFIRLEEGNRDAAECHEDKRNPLSFFGLGPFSAD